MKRVLIVHGWGANGQSNWFPWLARQLKKSGVVAYSPNLPKSIWPNSQEWLAEMRKIAQPMDRTLSVVGHSLGSVALLRLLESFSENEKIEKAIFVSGFARDLGISALASFFSKPFDWSKIKRGAEEFFVIHSDDDPVVPFEFGKELAEKLSARFIVEHNLGHLNAGIGDCTYPLLLDLLGAKK